MDKKDGLCTICCLSYNHSKFIEKAIESIWGQEYRNIEIIAVDDASNDNSKEILQKLQKQSPFAMNIITNDKNTGNVGLNLNKAIKQANGEYITFLSLDDKLYPDAISSKVEKMEHNSNIVLITNSQITVIDDRDKVIKKFDSSPKLDKISKPTVDDLLELDYELEGSFYIQGSIFRKDIVDEVGGFDEDMVGDDIILRTKILRYIKQKAELTFEVFKRPACYYRMHSNNLHKNGYRQIKTGAQYLEKYWPNRTPSKTFGEWLAFEINKADTQTIKKIFEINTITQNYFCEPENLVSLVENYRFLDKKIKKYKKIVKMLSIVILLLIITVVKLHIGE